MAIDLKFGKINIPGVPEDEPVFIIRAQDKLSIPAIARYRNHVRQAESQQTAPSPEFLEGLENVLEDFSDWQSANQDKVKFPD